MMETRMTTISFKPLGNYLYQAKEKASFNEVAIGALYVMYAVHKQYDNSPVSGTSLQFIQKNDGLLEDLASKVATHPSLNEFLVPFYDTLSKMSHEEYEAIYLNCVLSLSHFVAINGRKNSHEFYTTREVTKLMAMLTLHDGYHSVYDPFCGTAAISHFFFDSEKQFKFLGQDISYVSSLFARVNMEMASGKDEGIVNADSIKSWDNNPFDAVVSCPPLDLVLSQRYLDSLSYDISKAIHNPHELIVQRAFEINKAKMVMLLDSMSFCYRDGSERFRRFLVDHNLLEMVISLPAQLFYGTSNQSVIYICRSDRREEQPIRFIDTHPIFSSKEKLGVLSDVIYQEILNEDSSMCSSVLPETVIGTGYNLIPALYFRSNPELKKGQKIFRLSDLIEEVDGESVAPTDLAASVPKSLFSDDFIKVILNKDKDGAPLEEQYLRKDCKHYHAVSGEKYLLIPHTGYNNHIALRTDGRDFMSACSLVFRINEDNVSPDYLAYILTTDPIVKQKTLSLKNLMQMMFVIDDKKKQKQIVDSLLRQYDEEMRLVRETEAKRLGIKKNISDLEHMLGTTQIRIEEIISMLYDMTPGDISYQKTVKALKDNFEYMNRVIKYSNSNISADQMNLKAGVISEYIMGYTDGWRNYGGNYFRLEVVDNLPKGLTVVFDRVMLTVMLDSILSNAIRHGFHKRKNYTEDNRVEISLDVVKKAKKPYVLIKVSNNGDPMAEDFTIKDFVSRGRYSPETGRSGLGGYHIHQIATGHGGFLFIDSTKVWNMIVEVLIPITGEVDETMEEYEHECL